MSILLKTGKIYILICHHPSRIIVNKQELYVKRYLFAIVLASVMGITSTVMAASNFEKRQEITQKETLIRITAGEKVLFATLNDTQTARDFMATLPRTLPMKRLFDREY